MTTRAHIRDRTKLASALCIVLDIPFEHQKQMHEDHVLSLVQWDHNPIRKADGGPDVFWNLQPLLIAPHREKTASKDVPEIAKSKRIVLAEKDRGARIAAKLYGTALPEPKRRKRKIAQRANPWPQGRKMQSRKQMGRSNV